MRLIKTIADRMGHVPRWTIVQTIQNQTVAEHSYFVALYTMELCELFEYEHSADAINYALLHDLPEVFTGDIPSTLCDVLPKQVKLNHRRAAEDEFGVQIDGQARSRRIVKLADLLEAYLFIQREIELGNHSPHIADVRIYLKGKLDEAYSIVDPDAEYRRDFYKRYRI